MSSVIEFPARRVPPDTFPIRLAIVRAAMGGWNYDEAERATGINSETWRMWEKGKRRCADLEGVCLKLAAATGFSFEWLMIGGELASPTPPHNTPPHLTNPCLSGRRRIVQVWEPTRREVSAA